ncbi:hypothetical protein BP6252_01247 [Coleophoma cylindrospora]|uniref:Uncharacterized protein n=1 Tax=Coleophoma cylindrospora TaxID=1849047 RepID=A0A3D8SSE5_9HELO|nr:hypothetical protein BP6252_01247 [Coleophoma cylindrospora]
MTVKFNPDTDIPSLKGKVIFITGGTAGLGSASVTALAKHEPAHIYFSGRNTAAAEKLIASIKKDLPEAQLTFVNLDLTSIASVNTATQQFKHDRLDILMCNAGVMGTPPQLSKDGWEIQFATNHLGHAALIKQLLPVLLKTAEAPDSDVRIVINTSEGWTMHPKKGIDFDTLNTTQDAPFGNWVRYGQSKLANVIYARELARRYPSIKSAAVHPGIINTGLVGNLSLGNRLFVRATTIGRMVPLEQGVLNQLYLSACMKKEDIVNGSTYYPVGKELQKLDDAATSQELATKLWDWTEKAFQV